MVARRSEDKKKKRDGGRRDTAKWLKISKMSRVI